MPITITDHGALPTVDDLAISEEDGTVTFQDTAIGAEIDGEVLGAVLPTYSSTLGIQFTWVAKDDITINLADTKFRALEELLEHVRDLFVRTEDEAGTAAFLESWDS